MPHVYQHKEVGKNGAWARELGEELQRSAPEAISQSGVRSTSDFYDSS